MWFLVLIFAGGLACIPASIAKSKGYSFAGFWCLSFFLSFLIGLIVTLCLTDKNEYIRRDEAAELYGRQSDKRCVKCGAELRHDDSYCPKCGEEQLAPAIVQCNAAVYTPDLSSDNSYNVKDMQVMGDQMICPACNTVQRSNRTVCFKCGAEFTR